MKKYSLVYRYIRSNLNKIHKTFITRPQNSGSNGKRIKRFSHTSIPLPFPPPPQQNTDQQKLPKANFKKERYREKMNLHLTIRHGLYLLSCQEGILLRAQKSCLYGRQKVHSKVWSCSSIWEFRKLGIKGGSWSERNSMTPT